MIIVSVDDIQEVYIKGITIDGTSIPASDLEQLHDGQKHSQSGDLFSDYIYQGAGDTSTYPSSSLNNGYTLRIAVATATITSIQLSGSLNFFQVPNFSLTGIENLQPFFLRVAENKYTTLNVSKETRFLKVFVEFAVCIQLK